MGDVDIFVGNNTVIDPDVYQLWSNGFSAQEAANILQKRGILQQYGATMDMLLSDTMDHYRVFSMLERLLKQPPRLQEQLSFQITPDTCKLLIQRYYEFDDCVIREFLGKKLSSRNRKDLDDVSEKTKTTLKSCRRQFDNLKRVFKTVEEMKGSLVENIQMHFLLSDELSKKYAAIVFLTNNRFETGKKKLSFLSLQDFIHCASEMIVNWSYSAKECKHHEDMDVDLDRDFLIGLREVRVLLDKEVLDEHKMKVCGELKGTITDKAYADLESNFKNLSKNLVNIAYGLNHSKELKDFFIDLVEKFIEPCKQTHWLTTDVHTFLNVYASTASTLDITDRTNRVQLLKVWERYITTVTSCLLQMFHS